MKHCRAIGLGLLLTIIWAGSADIAHALADQPILGAQKSATPDKTSPLDKVLPQPSVDFEARAILGNSGKATFRHHGGKVRVDARPTGVPVMITAIVDVTAGKALVAIPGQRSAFEVDLNQDTNYGLLAGTGRKTGTSHVIAGEPCETWEVRAEGVDFPAFACITADGVMLRSEATIRDKAVVLMEVVTINRIEQEERLFSMPADYTIVRSGATDAAPAK